MGVARYLGKPSIQDAALPKTQPTDKIVPRQSGEQAHDLSGIVLSPTNQNLMRTSRTLERFLHLDPSPRGSCPIKIKQPAACRQGREIRHRGQHVPTRLPHPSHSAAPHAVAGRRDGCPGNLLLIANSPANSPFSRTGVRVSSASTRREIWDAMALPLSPDPFLCTCILHGVVRSDVVPTILFLNSMAAPALGPWFRLSSISFSPFTWDDSPSVARGELRNARSADTLAQGWMLFETLGSIPVPTPRPH
jgi:hypothetical protein